MAVFPAEGIGQVKEASSLYKDKGRESGGRSKSEGGELGGG